MTEIQLDGNIEYEFHLPSKTKDKQYIDPNRIKAYINALKSKCLQFNNGFILFPNGQGGYLDDKGNIHLEDISVLRTHGRMPFTNEEMEHYTDYLSQDSLFVIEAGERKAYLHKGKSQYAEINNYQYNYGDGSYTEYDIVQEPDGKRYIQVFQFDETGELDISKNLDENEISYLISMGAEVLAKINNIYLKSE